MNEDGFNDPVRVRNVPVAKVGERVHACTPRGVQRGVQKWLFVRVTCRIRNPKIVHPQFLPATNEEWPGIIPGPFLIGQRNTSGFGRRLAEGPSGRSCPCCQSTRTRKLPGSF